MNTPTIPDKRLGGSFHYDANGNFLRHDAPTRDPRKEHARKLQADAEAKAKGKAPAAAPAEPASTATSADAADTSSARGRGRGHSEI